MTLINLFKKIKHRFFRICFFLIFQYPRILKYKFISIGLNVHGRPRCYQPVLFEGYGTVVFGKGVSLGVVESPDFYTRYIYINARKECANIVFGSNIWVNNNCAFISEGAGIIIGDDTLIGANCEFIDSDFHDLHPDRRFGGNAKMGKVVIGKNVFIGSNVKVLKSVFIGDNSVIANGSIVTKSIPENVVAGGIPAKVLRHL